MIKSEIEICLTRHGFVRGSKRPDWTWHKEGLIYASIGSVPHLPVDAPFAVFVWVRSESANGKNYYTVESLDQYLKELNNKIMGV